MASSISYYYYAYYYYYYYYYYLGEEHLQLLAGDEADEDA